jgi:hypothetical protein
MPGSTRNSFRLNFDLVMAEIARWPIATTIVLTIIAAGFVLQPEALSELTPINRAIGVAGYLTGVLGLKGLWLLMAYPLMHKAHFPGSRLIASFMVFVPIMAFYATGLLVIVKQAGLAPMPATTAIPLLLFSYVLFSLFFAAAAAVMHSILPSGIRVNGMIRRALNRIFGRSQS